MVNIEVYEPKNNDDKKLKHVNPNVFMPPMRIILVGFSGSGKSNYMKNMLYNQQFGYKKYYDEIYIFCGSVDDCQEYERLAKKHRMSKKLRVISDDLDFQQIEDLYDDIEMENAENGNQTRVLFVFDDHITTKGFSSRAKMGVLDKVFVKGRHANISVIISTQKYRALNNNMRMTNATGLTIFGSPMMELQCIADEHSSFMDKKKMLELLMKTTQKRYHCINIDYKAPIEQRYKDRNFKVLLAKEPKP